MTYVIDVLDTNLAGTEQQLIMLLNGLDRQNFTASLLCFRDHAWLRENGSMILGAKHVIDIRYFRRAQTYWNLWKLRRYFRQTRPDVVHTFFPLANIIGAVVARTSGVRAVVSSRRDYGEWMSTRYVRLTRFANRFVDRIVANSPSVRRLTLARERVDPGKVEVILNGIDIASFRELRPDIKLRRSLGISDADRVVGIVGNFRPMKRHETFVRAAALVLRTRADVQFVLVGGSHSTLARKESLERLARELGIADRMRFVGAQPDVRPYLSIMDVGVNCSEQEGLSNAVIEYMAAGVPAVVSRSGGNCDLVQHGITGLSFELNDYEALARSVLELLNDEARRLLLAQNARDVVTTEMSPDKMVARYQSLYRTILG